MDPSERAGNNVLAYASPASFDRGSGFAIRTSSKSGPLTVDVYRMGWYGGAGGRKVYSIKDARPSKEESCNTDLETGLVECPWPDTFVIPGSVTETWTSGVFLARVNDASGKSTYVFFVMYDSKNTAPILAQLSTTTYQAYNEFGGSGIYGTFSPAVYGGGTFKYSRAVRVSFNRPYGEQAGVRKTGWGVGDFFNYDAMMVRFLERNGYDVSYLTNVDVDQVPGIVDNRKLFISMGHDEYWSTNQRNILESAVQQKGMNYAVFSGNSAYWHIRLEPSETGNEPARTVSCFRSVTPISDSPGDPKKTAPDATVLWRAPPLNRPETQLLSVGYPDARNVVTGAQFVNNPDHFAFEGTGLQTGDSLAAIFGHETDIALPSSPTTGITSIASSRFSRDFHYVLVKSDIQFYQATPTAGVVFEGATTGWTAQLGDTPVANPRTQQITANVLNRLGAPAATPAAPLQPTDTGVPITECKDAQWAGAVVADFGNKFPPKALDYFPGVGLAAGFPGASHMMIVNDEAPQTPRKVVTPWPVQAITHANGVFYVTGLDGRSRGHLGTVNPENGTFTALSFADAAFEIEFPSSIVYSETNGKRLYIGASHEKFVVVDLDGKTAQRVKLMSDEGARSSHGQAAMAMTPDTDGNLLALLGNGEPQDLVRIESSKLGSVVADAEVPTTILMPSENRNGRMFGRGYSLMLNSLGMVRSAEGDIYLTRAGTADVAHLSFPAGTGTGKPSLCRIAGTGKAGTRVGVETDLPVPGGIALASDGSLYVAETMSGRIIKLTKPAR